MNPTLLHFDITDDLPKGLSDGQRLHITAWIFVPESLSPRPSVFTLLNGGTYDKRYFHVEIPGHSGYSMAEYLCKLGHLVVLPDHLGIGDSARAARQMDVTREVAALANHAAVTQLYHRLRTGTLVPGLPAVPDFDKVGGGHSMGGMQTITQQARHQSYDRLVILGYTAIGVHLRVGDQLVCADPGPLDLSQADYTVRNRTFLHASFHWDDVPADVIAADDALNVAVPYVLSTQAITTGIVREDAAHLDVPIYLCLGERDVSPDPWAEPACYRRCRDFTLHVLQASGHCQNFASTRQQMWARIDRWNASLAG